MICAFNNMKANPDGCNRYFNSRLFEKYKKEYSRIVSERQTGEGNSQFGTMWITNESLEENKKILKDELIPNGWKKGKCNYKLKNENIIKFTNLTKLYNESELDWEEFKKENDIKSNLINFKVLVRKYSNMVILKKKNICKEDINYYKTLYKIFEKNTFNEFVNITGYDKEYNTLKYHFKKILKINISDKLLFTNDKNKEKRKEELKNLYQKYKDNDWENFINISGYDKTRKNLLRMFRRYNII